LQPEELTCLQRLRRMRNNLQHGTAKFNHRTGLTICHKAIIILDRFANTELGLWLGEVITENEWCRLSKIPELATRADRIAEECIPHIRQNPRSGISKCPRCRRDTLVRAEPNTGDPVFVVDIYPCSKMKTINLGSESLHAIAASSSGCRVLGSDVQSNVKPPRAVPSIYRRASCSRYPSRSYGRQFLQPPLTSLSVLVSVRMPSATEDDGSVARRNGTTRHYLRETQPNWRAIFGPSEIDGNGRARFTRFRPQNPSF
jgi:hypothetical protein